MTSQSRYHACPRGARSVLLLGLLTLCMAGLACTTAPPTDNNPQMATGSDADGGARTNATEPDDNDADGAISPANVTASATIGPEGGVLEITEPDDPLYGVRIDVLAGAVEAATKFTVGPATQTIDLPDGFQQLGPAIQLGPEGMQFELPVTVSLPYDDDGVNEYTVNVFRDPGPDRESEPCCVAEFDPNTNRIVGSTLGFSGFGLGATLLGATVQASFWVDDFITALDGMEGVVNRTNTCYAEARFVNWYWQEKKDELGPLSLWHTGDHQQLIELLQCVSLQDNRIDAFLRQRPDLQKPRTWSESDARQFSESLAHLLVARKKPINVGFTVNYADASRPAAGHAVLVYGMTLNSPAPGATTFHAYDPSLHNATPPKQLDIVYEPGQGIATSPAWSTGSYAAPTSFGLHGDYVRDTVFDFVFRYIDEPPEIVETTPQGAIANPRPPIQAVVHYPYIEHVSFSLLLDDGPVDPAIELLGPHAARLSFTPTQDLSEGQHTVVVRVSNEDLLPNCLPDVVTHWQFTIDDDGQEPSADTPGTLSAGITLEGNITVGTMGLVEHAHQGTGRSDGGRLTLRTDCEIAASTGKDGALITTEDVLLETGTYNFTNVELGRLQVQGQVTIRCTDRFVADYIVAVGNDLNVLSISAERLIRIGGMSPSTLNPFDHALVTLAQADLCIRRAGNIYAPVRLFADGLMGWGGRYGASTGEPGGAGGTVIIDAGTSTATVNGIYACGATGGDAGEPDRDQATPQPGYDGGRGGDGGTVDIVASQIHVGAIACNGGNGGDASGGTCVNIAYPRFELECADDGRAGDGGNGGVIKIRGVLTKADAVFAVQGGAGGHGFQLDDADGADGSPGLVDIR